MDIPKCCGKEMKIIANMARHIELECEKCGDTIFLKKGDAEKPVMIDD